MFHGEHGNKDIGFLQAIQKYAFSNKHYVLHHTYLFIYVYKIAVYS